MRNFSLISIVLVLAAGALVWQKLIVDSAPERTPELAPYSSYQNDIDGQEGSTVDGDAESMNDDNTDSGFESEQEEMADQQSRSHDVMMKSFDQKHDKYRQQINGE